MRCVNYDASVKHDGKVHQFVVKSLQLPVCSSCNERVFTSDVDAQVNAALRAHLGLLTPDEIRQSLQSLRISQKDLAERLRIAEATLSRWLNGVQIQSRSMDLLIRLYLGSREAQGYVAALNEGTVTTVVAPESAKPLAVGTPIFVIMGTESSRVAEYSKAQRIIQHSNSTWGCSKNRVKELV